MNVGDSIYFQEVIVVNSSEKRRKQLLEQTRKLYCDQEIPAVHPRYGMAYAGLYPEAGMQTESGSFGVRFFLSFLLFALFVSIDYDGREIMNVNSEKVVDEIRMDMDVEEVWKNL